MRRATIVVMSPVTATLPPPPAICADWALFLDVDGTLLEFSEHPDDVHVPGDLIDALAALQRRLDGALALVSGRPLAQLDQLFAPLHLPAAGLHGLEQRGADTTASPDPPAALRAIRDQAEAIASQYPGALIEDKGAALALHWRGNPAARLALSALADAALPGLCDYRLQRGDHVVELRPIGDDKGMAVAAMLDDAPFKGRHPVFVGDDHSDEHGFDAVREHGGFAVLVGDRTPSAARYRLADCKAVHDWLVREAS